MFKKVLRSLRQVEATEVSEAEFRSEIAYANHSARASIEGFIFANRDKIKEFRFGHVPGHRVYEIVLTEGEPKKWDLWRKRSRHRSWGTRW